MLTLIMLFLHLMKPTEFRVILEQALQAQALAHGISYPTGGAASWGLTGAAYLAFALCGLPSAQLRIIQYQTRDEYGPVILDCKWYDSLKHECLNGQDSVDTLLPGPDGTLRECRVTAGLFLEMLDFCREG